MPPRVENLIEPYLEKHLPSFNFVTLFKYSIEG